MSKLLPYIGWGLAVWFVLAIGVVKIFHEVRYTDRFDDPYQS